MKSTKIGRLGLLAGCLFQTMLMALLIVSPVRVDAWGTKPLQVGDVPPGDLGKDAAGNPIRLSDYRGRLVIVSFWASWCAPCRSELPVLASIQKQATRDKVAVFAVNWKQPHQEFLEITRVMKSIDLTLVSDASGSLGRQYDIHAIPHMIIIGRDGRIAAIHIGYGESEIPVLVKEINGLWNAVPPEG